MVYADLSKTRWGLAPSIEIYPMNLTSPRRLAPTPPQIEMMDQIATQLNTMNIHDLGTQETVQIRADVTSNEKGTKDIRPYVGSVAIDIVMTAPEKLKKYLMLDDRKNMALISIVAMVESNCFSIGAPKTIAEFLLASEHTVIECEDGNTIQLTFSPAGDAASANKGSFLWCHVIIGAFDPTKLADLITAIDAHMKKLGLDAVRTKAITDKIAGTWTKKVHVDLKLTPNHVFSRTELSQTEFALPAGMRATVNWGKDMRAHYGLCTGPCSRVIKTVEFGEYGESRIGVDKNNCMCKSKSDGPSVHEKKRAANAYWDRNMKKKPSPGAGPSGT